jgi:hypothetical protein
MVVGRPVNECIATANDSRSSGPESSEIDREIMVSPPKGILQPVQAKNRHMINKK